MDSVEHTKKLKDILIDKRVKIVPIKRESPFLPKGHDGEFMYTDTVWSTDLPVSVKTNSRIPILTRDEQEIFEKELNLEKGDMSFYNKDKGFWASSKGRVSLTKEGMTLNLNEPMDFIKYKILLTSPQIAPSWKEKLNSGNYKFAIVDEEEVTKETNNKYELMKEVYRYFGKIDESAKAMSDVLKLYGKRTDSTKLDFLKAEIQKLIDKDPAEFVAIMSNKHFNLKVLIEDAKQARAIEFTKDGYKQIGGDMIGRNIKEAIEWFENPNNSDIVLEIKARIENTK